MILVALIFAILHIGHRPLLDILFVLGVGLLFGWMVVKTRSLLGVTLAHGVINIMLFVVLPLSPAPNRSLAPSVQGTPLSPRTQGGRPIRFGDPHWGSAATDTSGVLTLEAPTTPTIEATLTPSANTG